MFGDHFIFHAGQYAEFAFHGHIILVCIFHNAASQFHILVVGQMRTVNHNRRETEVYAALAKLERISVVKVEHDFRMLTSHLFGILNSTFGHVAQQRLVCIVACSL